MKKENINGALGLALIIMGIATPIIAYHINRTSPHVNTLSLNCVHGEHINSFYRNQNTYNESSYILKKPSIDNRYLVIEKNQYVLSKYFDLENENSKQLLDAEIILSYSKYNQEVNFKEKFTVDERIVINGKSWYRIKNSNKIISSKYICIINEKFRGEKTFSESSEVSIYQSFPDY